MQNSLVPDTSFVEKFQYLLAFLVLELLLVKPAPPDTLWTLELCP